MKAIAAGIVAAVLLVVVVIYWSEYGPPTQTQGVPAQDAPPTATTPPLVVTPTPTTRPARATPTRPARPTLTAFRERASATPPPTATPRPTPRPTPTPFLTPQRAPTPTPFRAPQPTIIPPPTPIQPGFTPFSVGTPIGPIPTVAVPTSTPVRPTPTAFQDLCDVRDQECVQDFEPIVSPIAWNPTLSAGGVFSADIQIRTPIGALRWPPALLAAWGEGFYVGVTLYRASDPIASITAPPPANADWEWTGTPGEYEADTFRLVGDSTLRVRARVSPQLHGEAERACFWNGRDLVGCAGLG